MEVKTIKTDWGGDLKQNTHVIIGENTCVVIDAGCPIQDIKNLTPLPIEAVFITHGHFDHVEYIEEYDKLGVPIYVSEETPMFLKDTNLNVSRCKTYKVNNLVPLDDGDKIESCVGTIECIKTPGHSEDSMCYLLYGETNTLFTGDTVFSVAMGRDDLPTGDTIQLLASLDRILNLDFNEMYTGHGRVSTKEEQKTNIPKWINYFRNTKTI
ncbi:MAG: MBL fold metallo-hydrolase [Clostridia bacterium]|nr:MBL fold metallo-hydrolase [Clostridia bacterium]